MHHTTASEDRPSCRSQVMENGDRNDVTTFKPHRAPPHPVSGNINDKSQSLPGFYRSPAQIQYTSYDKAPLAPAHGNKPVWNNPGALKDKNCDVKPIKSYKHIIGNLFTRKKKDLADEANSFSEKDSENSHENDAGFDKTNNIRQRKTLQSSHYDNIINSTPVNNSHTDLQYQKRNVYYPTQHLNRVFSHEELNRNNQHALTNNKYISMGTPPYANQRKLVPSISYDSLPASGISMNSESAYGSINSVRSQSTGKGERSPGMDSLTHRERREAIMAKVKKIRDKHANSSSDEDRASHSSLPDSMSSFKTSPTVRKSKSSRTERYLRRKSQECENLRKETEKDKRSKAKVQARILEIQNIKAHESQRKSSQDAETDQLRERPRWSASLVYEESNEYNSITIPTPTTISSEPLKHQSSYETSRLNQNNLKNIKLNSLNHNKIPANSYTSRSPSRERNESGFARKSNLDIGAIRKGGLSPPQPPPRDASRFISPRELHRPFSYSFENINHNAGAYSQPSNRGLFSPTRTCSNSTDVSFTFSTNRAKRALSEQKLNQPTSPVNSKPINRMSQNASCFNFVQPPKPQRASVTVIPGKDAKLSLLNFKNTHSISESNVSEVNQSFEDNRKYISVPNKPPSPSSDYASYVSENSSLVTNLSSPRLMSRQEFRERVTESSVEALAKSTPIKVPSGSVHPQEKPEPPRRDFSSLNKGSSEQLRQTLKQTGKSTTLVNEERKKLEELYQLEKDRIIKSKCSNLEQAIKELEELYNNLDLNSEDILDRAERRDLPTEHQLMWARNSENSTSLKNPTSPLLIRQKTPKLRRSCTPDKVTDDVHYRRCMEAKPKPLAKQQNLPSASYMLFSPVHSPTLDSDEPYHQNGITRKEPNITSDDVTYRNVQRANAVKIIDPQPPFGIPLGPVTQGSTSDYLHLQAKDNYKPMLASRKYPDVVMDDMAFRNLRKDTSLSEKSLNLSELDSILSETEIISKPIRNVRSISLDRCSHVNSGAATHQKTSSGAPRHIRNMKRKSTKSKFYEGYKGALTDSEGIVRRSFAPTTRGGYPQSIANDNIDSSTETLTEQCNSRSSIQSKRSAIVDESKYPAGAPSLMEEDTEDNPFKDPSSYYPASRISDGPMNSESPFKNPLPKGSVDITKLNDLISTIKTPGSSTGSETCHNSQLPISKCNLSKSVAIRPTSSVEMRKGNTLSLIDAGKPEGNEINRRHSSIGVSSSECCSSYVNGMSYLAIANSRIPGPSKPERIFITDPTSLKLVIDSQLEALRLTSDKSCGGGNDVHTFETEFTRYVEPAAGIDESSNLPSTKNCELNNNPELDHCYSNREYTPDSNGIDPATTHPETVAMPYKSDVANDKRRLSSNCDHPTQTNIKNPSVTATVKNNFPEKVTKPQGNIFPQRMCQGEILPCQPNDLSECHMHVLISFCFLLCMLHFTGVDLFTAFTLILAIATVFLTFSS